MKKNKQEHKKTRDELYTKTVVSHGFRRINTNTMIGR